MILYWTLIIIFCFNLRVCVAFSEVEDEITALKSNISSFISFTAVDDILDNEYFSKAIDALFLIPNPAAKMISLLVKSEMDDRDKKQILNSLVQTIIAGISGINANRQSIEMEMEAFEYYFAFVQAFEPAICQFKTDPDSVIRYARETLEVIDRIFRKTYNKTEYQQHEIIKQNFLTDISKLDPKIAFKIVNTVQSDFVKHRNVKLSTIDDIILPPYAYRET